MLTFFQGSAKSMSKMPWGGAHLMEGNRVWGCMGDECHKGGIFIGYLLDSSNSGILLAPQQCFADVFEKAQQKSLLA